MKCALQCEVEILFQTKGGNTSVMRSEGEGATAPGSMNVLTW